jgi:hypothetical protein
MYEELKRLAESERQRRAPMRDGDGLDYRGLNADP